MFDKWYSIPGQEAKIGTDTGFHNFKEITEWIPDSKRRLDSGFQTQKFTGFRVTGSSNDILANTIHGFSNKD